MVRLGDECVECVYLLHSYWIALPVVVASTRGCFLFEVLPRKNPCVHFRFTFRYLPFHVLIVSLVY